MSELSKYYLFDPKFRYISASASIFYTLAPETDMETEVDHAKVTPTSATESHDIHGFDEGFGKWMVRKPVVVNKMIVHN